MPDYKDECPNTTSGVAVNAVGCVPGAMVLMEVTLKVHFAFNSDVITSTYNADIKRVADFMKKAPDSSVWIEGHTDSTGPDAYNQDLSQRRAAAVAARLTSDYGIAADRVTAVGYGEARPKTDNSTLFKRSQNRRVKAIVKGMVAK